MEIIRRSYKETWFWFLVAGIIYTLISDYYGLSNIEIKQYAEGMVKKVAANTVSIYMFLGSVIMLIKTTVENIQKRKINKDIVLATTEQAIVERQAAVKNTVLRKGRSEIKSTLQALNKTPNVKRTRKKKQDANNPAANTQESQTPAD